MTLQIGQGNQHDSQVFDSLIDFDHPPLAIVADKAYDSAHIRQVIADEGALAVIPSKSNAKNPIEHDRPLYRMRNIVERFFCRMKEMRRIATRYERTKRNFASLVYLFAARLCINIESGP